MLRFITSVLLLAVLSFSLPGCFDKTYPIQSAPAKQTISIKIAPPSSFGNLSIYANNSIVAYLSASNSAYPDSIIVPDSARLDAYWGANHRDTIASPGLVWHISQ